MSLEWKIEAVTDAESGDNDKDDLTAAKAVLVPASDASRAS